jgi:hypothetical protein
LRLKSTDREWTLETEGQGLDLIFVARAFEPSVVRTFFIKDIAAIREGSGDDALRGVTEAATTGRVAQL